MQRDLKRLANEHYDLLVIGGGINGLATAWDAALRGLMVAVVERSDFGSETSAATLKLIHGGLRYLQHLDIVRMRQSIRERSNMLRLAPHLVSPLPFLIPTKGRGVNSRAAMSAAIIANELVGLDRNRRIQDPDRKLPRGHVWLSRSQAHNLVPELDSDAITGGVVFYDAQMYNSERLTLAFALSAFERGADLANYIHADRLLVDEYRVTGARVRDLIGGGQFDITADMVVNTTGPWSDIILDQIDNPRPSRRVLRSKGIQIVVPSLTEIGLAVQSTHQDPDARVDVGGRRFFITPWRGHSLIGTTDTLYEGDPDDFRITEKDIRAFLAEINTAYPAAKLERDHVKYTFGGLRPITESKIGKGSSVSRKYEINDHAKDLKLEGLISVVGVKYTTCRLLAEKVVDLVFRKMGKSSPRPATESIRLVGGEIDYVAGYINHAVMKDDGLYGERAIRHLICSYGTQYEDVLKLVDEDPGLGSFIADSNEIIKAEIVYVIRNECAHHLEDIIMRRTDLGTLGHPGRAALEECADIAAKELGWDDFIRDNEVKRAERCFVFD